MKHWLVGCGFCLWIMGSSTRCEASWQDWPGIKQGSDVVRCVLMDSGTIVSSFVTHVTGFTVETLQTVGKCLLYTTAKLTPLPDLPDTP